jgi:large subunit ribosomal protein L13
MLVKKPTEALRKAVSGMLPKNKLRKNMISRLKLVV